MIAEFTSRIIKNFYFIVVVIISNKSCIGDTNSTNLNRPIFFNGADSLKKAKVIVNDSLLAGESFL